MLGHNSVLIEYNMLVIFNLGQFNSVVFFDWLILMFKDLYFLCIALYSQCNNFFYFQRRIRSSVHLLLSDQIYGTVVQACHLESTTILPYLVLVMISW